MFDEFDMMLLGICGLGVMCLGEVKIVCVLLMVYYYLLCVIVCYWESNLKIWLKVFDVGVNVVLNVVVCSEVDFGVNFMGS